MFYKGTLLASVVCFLDQLHKWYMIEIVDIANHPPIEVTGFFNLVMVWNRGASFGMGGSAEHAFWIFSSLTVLIVSVLLWWLRKAPSMLMMLALGLIIGGAIGNLIDRIRFGAVADFFDFHLYGYHWPAFNIADSAVFLGAFMLILDSIKTKPHTANANEKN